MSTNEKPAVPGSAEDNYGYHEQPEDNAASAANMEGGQKKAFDTDPSEGVVKKQGKLKTMFSNASSKMSRFFGKGMDKVNEKASNVSNAIMKDKDFETITVKELGQNIGEAAMKPVNETASTISQAMFKDMENPEDISLAELAKNVGEFIKTRMAERKKISDARKELEDMARKLEREEMAEDFKKAKEFVGKQMNGIAQYARNAWNKAKYETGLSKARRDTTLNDFKLDGMKLDYERKMQEMQEAIKKQEQTVDKNKAEMRLYEMKLNKTGKKTEQLKQTNNIELVGSPQELRQAA